MPLLAQSLFALTLFVSFLLKATTASTTTLSDARPLLFHVTLKRSSMKLYGHLEFDVFANPVVSDDNDAVRYDGYATFEQGDTKRKIMLVDGIAYIVTSAANGTQVAECSSSASLALLNSFIPALNNANFISSAKTDNKTLMCSSGDMFDVVLEDAIFILCKVSSRGVFAYGSDLNIRAKYLDTILPIKAPMLSKGAAHSCDTIVTPSPVTPTTLALLTGSE